MIRVIKNTDIGIIYIDRPEHYNALNIELIQNLLIEFQKLISNNKIKVVIITGAGEKSFVAGADIIEMSKMNKEMALSFSSKGHELMNLIQSSKKPIISAINGFALGGGCELALSSHIRFASDKAVFGQPEVGLGLIAGFGGTQRLSKIIGYSNAVELLIRGNKIKADEAYRIGLINAITEECVLEYSIRVAEEISSKSIEAIKKTLYLINNDYLKNIEDGLNKEIDIFSELFETSETKEGLDAYVQKRKPNFK